MERVNGNVEFTMETENGTGGPTGGHGWRGWVDVASCCTVVATACLWASCAWWFAQPGGGLEFLHPGVFSLWRSRVVVVGIPVGVAVLATQMFLLVPLALRGRPWREMLQLAAFATAFWMLMVVGGSVFTRILNLAPAAARYAEFYREMRARSPNQPPLLPLPGLREEGSTGKARMVYPPSVRRASEPPSLRNACGGVGGMRRWAGLDRAGSRPTGAIASENGLAGPGRGRGSGHRQHAIGTI